MNRIIVDGVPYLLTDAYLAGALANRFGAEQSQNPYTMSDRGHDQWKQGYIHEAELLHICEDEDVVQYSHTGSRSFFTARPAIPSKTPKRDALAYAHARMKASGMLHDTRAIVSHEGLPTPGALVERLRQRGHALTIPFANLVIRRLQLESEMAEAKFSQRELRAVETMTPLQRSFLFAVAKLQDAYYDRYLPIQMIARHFGKKEPWAYSMTRMFARDGLKFLVQGSAAVCRPTAKGWIAIELLRSLEVRLEGDAPTRPIAV